MNKILDLFCGAGGFSYGFLDNSNTFIGIDIWNVALETYRDNIKGEFIQADLASFSIESIGKIDILIGSPPCPTFSGMNVRGNRNYDPSLINIYMKIKDILKPKWWIMEESPYAAFLVDNPRFLCANDFGLYQKRKRLFAGNYPDIKPTKVCRKIHPAVVAHEVKGFNKNMKLHEHARGACQYFGRRLSSWELQILMGFPPDYRFHGNYTERCLQIGNAVCPPVARAIWNAIKEGKTRNIQMKVI